MSNADHARLRAREAEASETNNALRWLNMRRRWWFEPPEPPPAPSVEAAGPDSLSVTWTVPDSATEILDYDVEYLLHEADEFTAWDHTGTTTRTTITSLAPSTAHDVRVRASNDAGPGDWSPLGAGTTANAPPSFREGATATRFLAENTPADEDIGTPVEATDAEYDPLTYALGGLDALSLDIDEASGQLRTRAGIAYDHEAADELAVTVEVRDEHGGSASIDVTIAVSDVDEPPGPPPEPTVAGVSSTALEVAWSEPGNTGPAIGDYDVRVRVDGSDDDFVDADHAGTARTATIAGLVPSTTYEVQVRAANDEGTGRWSESGRATTHANRPPSFDEGAVGSRAVAENTPAEQDIGEPVSATDPDDDTLSYSLGGTDADRYAVDTGTGQLRTHGMLDHERDAGDEVTVTVADGYGGEASIAVTVSVADEDEPPAPVAAPAVGGVSGSAVEVTWSEPDGRGPPITDYDVQYRLAASGSPFIDAAHAGTSQVAALRRLAATTEYEVQVRATNDEGTGGWSASGTGTTLANAPPVFDEGQRTSRELAENTPGNRDIGGPVGATDAEDWPLRYTVGGRDAGHLDIDEASGQLRTRAGIAYDHEAADELAVTVEVRDEHGGSASIDVTIAVSDVDEPPGPPPEPTVAGVSSTALEVAWSEPGNTGPAIGDYDVRVRVDGSDDDFVDADHAGTARTATIAGLVPSTTYEVQVRAANDEGTGRWSESGRATTHANRPPSFDEGAVGSRAVAENTPAEQDIGEPVSATDPDDDTLSYSLGGTDADRYAVDTGTGQLRTHGMLDHERDAGDEVTVTVADGYGGEASIAVTVSVADEDEPPAPVAAPAVGGVSGSAVEVTWSEPDGRGPPITDYDVQYRLAASGSPFIDAAHAGTSQVAALRRLAATTEYEVQVRATNDEGTGGWSASGTGTTLANAPPVFDEGQRTSRELAENTPGNRDIGGPVGATDAEDWPLRYTVGGRDAGHLDIDEASGQLRTRAGIAYDHEAADELAVTVEVRDEHGGSASIDVTIAVSDVDEPPGPPPEPTVAGVSSTALEVAWSEPGNTGPAIGDYDVRVRVDGSDDDFVDADHAGTARTATIAGLVPSTTYEVQVRAANDEGTGRWSESGRATTHANRPPSFDEGAVGSRAVAENTPAEQDIGEPVSATDPDDDTLSYSLGGTDADRYAVDTGTGQLRTHGMLDHERDAGDEVTVTVADGYGGEASIAVTVSVADEDEPPAPVAAPAVGGVSGSAVEVTWSEPDGRGPPITDYDVQYRLAASGSPFIDAAHAGTSQVAALRRLAATTEYEVQVRATNDEGTGGWSASGTGTTLANAPPVFDEGQRTSRELAENTPGNRDIGGPVGATDAEDWPLRYTVGGRDAGHLDIDEASGQLRTRAGIAYDHEAADELAVTVEVRDEHGGSASIDVTIAVSDVDEPPGPPPEPTVAGVSSTALEVAWSEPGNTGPAIGDYDVRVRVDGSDDDFVDADHAGTARTATIAGLVPSTTYEVQVRAANDEGTGRWSESGRATTHANRPPSFDEGAVGSRAVAENTPAEQDIGEPVSATDPDDDTLSYSLGGTDADRYAVDTGTGQLRTHGMLDHERDAGDEVTVTVADGYGGDASIAVTVSVADEDEPPSRVAAPTVTSVSGAAVEVTWSAPRNGGPPITDYDVQYRVADSNDTFNDGAHTGTRRIATLRGLAATTEYEVQVRATNDEGTGRWSASGTGSTLVNAAPVFDEGKSTSRQLAENTPGNRNVGGPVKATDAEGDRLTYTLGGPDSSAFTIVTTTGQIRTRPGGFYDHEADPSLDVTVSANDNRGNAAEIAVTVDVTDVSEPPIAPAVPDVKDSGPDSVDVTWTAPANNGRPPITGYNLRYRSTGSFVVWPHTAAASDRYAELTGLDAGDYEVQVRALNAEGNGAWSRSGRATISSNHAPVVDASRLRDVVVAVGGEDEVVPVRAAFSDSDGDRLTLAAASRNDGIATATLSGDSVRIHAAAAGTVDVDVTATDPDGASATGSLKVTVDSAPPPAPGLSLNAAQDTLTLAITDSFGPREARAYRIRIRPKSRPDDLHTYCATLTSNSDDSVTATVDVPIPIGSFVESNTTYQVNYRYLGLGLFGRTGERMVRGCGDHDRHPADRGRLQHRYRVRGYPTVGYAQIGDQ